jgi:transposase
VLLAAAAARFSALGHGVLVFQRWNAEGTTDRIHDALRAAVRGHSGRDPMASAGIVDAQSVKGADTVPAASRGFDAGKKVNGRKRHVVVDTLGLLVVVLVTAASLQDRDGGRLVLAQARMAMPSIVLVWADGGYAGRAVAFARQFLRITLQIVRKPAGQRTFEVLPRRWVVERTLSWLVRCRRLDRDYERLPEHAEAMVKWTMIGLMTAVSHQPPPPPLATSQSQLTLSQHVLRDGQRARAVIRPRAGRRRSCRRRSGC